MTGRLLGVTGKHPPIGQPTSGRRIGAQALRNGGHWKSCVEENRVWIMEANITPFCSNLAAATLCAWCAALPHQSSAQAWHRGRILPGDAGGKPRPAATAAARERMLANDVKRLRALTAAMQAMAREMQALQQSVGVKKRKHFTSDEHDAIEGLLFRYLVCRESLWDIVEFYAGIESAPPHPPEWTKGFVIGLNAAIQLSHYGSRLVETFLDEPAVIAKLNEAYFRYEIPAQTYDRLFDSVTAIKNIEALKLAWTLFREEQANPKSSLSVLAKSDTPYRDLIHQIQTLHPLAEAQTRSILEKRSLLLPDLRNRLRQTMLVDLARRARREFGSNLEAARAVLYNGVGRIKAPLGALLHLSPAQEQQVKSLLRPGDLILTYKSGYMSNVFLPGRFKHGITYVGTPEQRRKLGLDVAAARNVPAPRREKLQQDLGVDRLPSGHRADLIEAVAEGVIFNSLDRLAEEHLNRMVVIRPRLTQQQRAEQLATVFLLLGSGYDFDFDFNDASCQCCTEVIYRSLHGQGPVSFRLVARLGRQTLSPDDILQHYLHDRPRSFDFVLFAAPGAGGEDSASVRSGPAGEKQFTKWLGTTFADSVLKPFRFSLPHEP